MLVIFAAATWRDTTVCGDPIPSMYAFTLTKIASNRVVLYGGYPVDGQCSQKVYLLEYVDREMVSYFVAHSSIPVLLMCA